MSDVFGYVRVSSRDQNEDRQLLAMREQGIPDKNIYIDKQSGKDFQRPAYNRMVRRLKPGDLLYIKSIDRLGRNYEEIQVQWRILAKEKRIDIVVLDMPLLDTRRGKDLVGTFLSDIVLQVLSFVAENERTNIKQRQAEGISAAKIRGVRFGRPPRPIPEDFANAFLRWERGEISGRAAARECGMPRSTFYKKSETLSTISEQLDIINGEISQNAYISGIVAPLFSTPIIVQKFTEMKGKTVDFSLFESGWPLSQKVYILRQGQIHKESAGFVRKTPLFRKLHCDF